MMAISNWYQLSSLRLEWQACRAVRRGFAGVVHLLWGERDLGFLDLLLRRSRLPVCCTFHSCCDTLATAIKFPQRLRRLDGVFLVSKTQQPVMENYGVAPEKIHVIPHGVDTRHFRPSPRRDRTSFTVASVGSYRRKFPLVREVCCRLRGVPNIRVVVVAPEPFRATFAGLENVAFLSGLTDHQLLHVYQEASCLLMTAENATANNAVLEAMACGLPIVSERVGGIPEYVDERCAQLTTPDKADELAAAIIALSLSTPRVMEMRNAARAKAETLDWRCIADRNAEVYRSLAPEASAK
jgi:glycosyltransferase involved in cell wall biosynthesis